MEGPPPQPIEKPRLKVAGLDILRGRDFAYGAITRPSPIRADLVRGA